MNQEIKAQWLAALRSGEYEQTQGSLRVGDKYCCLGVLCDLAVRAGVIPPAEQNDDDGQYTYGSTHEYGVLPREVADWAGISPRGVLPDGEESLIGLNDRQGLSFMAIANTIEDEF